MIFYKDKKNYQKKQFNENNTINNNYTINNIKNILTKAIRITTLTMIVIIIKLTVINITLIRIKISIIRITLIIIVMTKKYDEITSIIIIIIPDVDTSKHHKHAANRTKVMEKSPRP